jgi:hypothetical protein
MYIHALKKLKKKRRAMRKQSKPFLNIHRINVSPVNLPCDEKRAGGFFSERESNK